MNDSGDSIDTTGWMYTSFDSSIRCSTCGAPIPHDLRCVACLLRAALPGKSDDPTCETGFDVDDGPPTLVGNYEILSKLGAGGMGVVYLARCLHAKKLVALKMIRSDMRIGAQLRLFRREIEATLAAEHPHMVPLLHVGEHEGQLYYTMRLFHSSLDQRLDEFRKPDAAVELIETVARAVEHAHGRGVLHLDLKPANVLLDPKGRPHVADFGLARLLSTSEAAASDLPDPQGSPPVWESHPSWSAKGSSIALGGTLPYMAPEQGQGCATIACDVYSLGAMLYELLTGMPPDSRWEVRSSRAYLVPRPPVLASSMRTIDPDLAAICLRCLSEDSAQRYRYAGDLADDLARWRRGEPVRARPKLSWRRVRHLAMRHKLIAALLLLVGILGIALAIMTQRLQVKTVDATVAGNAYAALHLAGNVLRELRDYTATLQRLSDDPLLIELVTGLPVSDARVLEPYLQGVFNSIGVYTLDGVRNARWPIPVPDGVVDLDFGWRDYYLGAMAACRAGRRDAYVARSILSEGDGKHKLVLSAPLFDGDRCVGVLMATISSAATLNALRLDSSTPAGPTGTLLGLKDRSRVNPSGAMPRDYMVLVHDDLVEGRTAEIDSSFASRVLDAWGPPLGAGQQLRPTRSNPLHEDDYRDPVPGFEGRWLAGLAPVGRTGLVVLVQTRYRDAVGPSEEMTTDMATLMLALLLVAALAAIAAKVNEGVRIRSARE